MSRRVQTLLILLTVLILTGCGAPAEVSPVYTDWSKLTPYQPIEAQYTKFEPYSGDGALQPRDDYGPLLPYIGAYTNTHSYMGPLPLLGLVTQDGRLVTAPVYAEITVPSYNRTGRQERFLILSRGVAEDRHTDEYGYTYLDGHFDYTVAAMDGSWVRTFPDCYNCFLLDDSHLVLSGNDGSVTVIDETGETVCAYTASDFAPWLGDDFRWDWEGGPSLNCSDGRLYIWQWGEDDPDGDGIRCYLDVANGTVTSSPPATVYPEPSGEWIMGSQSLPGYEHPTPIPDPITGKTYFYGRNWDDVQEMYTSGDMLTEDGTVLLSDCALDYIHLGIGEGFAPWVWGDRIACAEDGVFCYYDLDGDCVFRYPVASNDD